MDLQSYLTNAVNTARDARFEDSDQLTLGDIISKIEPIAERFNNGTDKNEAIVMYDFGNLHPSTIDSWRGAYRELALDYTEENEPLGVNAFLKLLKDADGKEFTGYKGGEFLMSKNTPVWVANYGYGSETAVVDIVDDGWRAIIITGLREY